MDAKEMRGLKKARNRQAQIHRNTRKDMLWHSEGMRAHSLRGYRQPRHLSTNRTTLPVPGQRYSIDLTPGRVRPRPKHIAPCKAVTVWHPDGTSERISQQELELVLPSSPIPFPDPAFLTDFDHFKRCWKYEPPYNDSVYLDLGDTFIENAQMFHMTDVLGNNCYMTDCMIDTCLSILGTNKNIHASGIAIMNSVESQICVLPGDDGKEAYAQKYANTPIILVPINDAMGFTIDKEEEKTQLDQRAGSHWTLLLFDRRYKKIYYYDSFTVNSKDVQQHVCVISNEMLKVLGEDATQGWDLRFQTHCPHQVYHNGCVDYGACGPFVWTMAKLCVEQVQKSPGEEIPDLTRETQEQFARHWKSTEARERMRESVEAVRRVRDYQSWADGRGARGSAEEGNVQVSQGSLWVSRVVGDQTHESLARVEEFDSDAESSFATMGSGETLVDERLASEGVDSPAEDILNSARLDSQDGVLVIRSIDHDASIAEDEQSVTEVKRI